MLKPISFLIGAGFSIPAGYPSTAKLNERLRKIDANELHVHTDGSAWFIDRSKNSHLLCIEKEKQQFVQHFLEFYVSKELKQLQDFHYETFYDYYWDAIESGQYSDHLSSFLDDFCHRDGVDQDESGIMTGFDPTFSPGSWNPEDMRQHQRELLQSFDRIFSQLIAFLLRKELRRTQMGKPYCPKYRSFLCLVEKLSKTHLVHLHTLNHDLYLEHLSVSDAMQSDMDDGFEIQGSPLFVLRDGANGKDHIKVSRFTNSFSKRFRLYKLHGSINYFVCCEGSESHLVKLPGMDYIYEEKVEDGDTKNHSLMILPVPVFLTGTTRKEKRYERGNNYFSAVIEHFKENLRRSDALIVIGYGFGDLGINKIVEECFLSVPSKVMFVVGDGERPEQCPSGPNIVYEHRGVSGMDSESILRRVV